MLHPLLRRLKRSSPPAPGENSTQVYCWPVGVRRAVLLAPWLAGVLVVVGVLFMGAGAKAQSFEQVTSGLLELTLGLSLIVGVLVLHLVGAREVRFTRDSLVIRQTGRRELVLPYCEYQQEWVADLSNPHAVRLIVFGFNRGCMLVLPPEWVVGALREVRRIQEEEGWYSPERIGDE